MTARPLLALLAVTSGWLAALAPLPAQRWAEAFGRSPAGAVARHQAAVDAGADALVLLVASHPDDRYLLPAVWLRAAYGMRVSVLLATRGGGGQNSSGPETGDALERLRTLETEAGCAQLGCPVWYLNCPDGGYRRSATETFAEWGRERTLNDLVRLLREIRPDAVATTHNREEAHGHDLALVELLPEAIRAAADPNVAVGGAPHQVGLLMLGAGSSPSPDVVRVDADHLDVERGASWRRIAYGVLRSAHTSPGAPAPIDAVFDPELRLEPNRPVVLEGPRPLGLPSVFDSAIWPGAAARSAALEQQLSGLRERTGRGELNATELVPLLHELRQLRDTLAADAVDVRRRLDHRIDAIERLLLLVEEIQIELEVPPGTVAIAGEAFPVTLHGHGRVGQTLSLRAEGLDGVDVAVTALDGPPPRQSTTRALLEVRMPLRDAHDVDPMAQRFAADRFVPPVRIRFWIGVGDVEVPAVIVVPVEQRAPVQLSVVPRMLLLPSGRRRVQFSVGVTRNTRFPVESDVEVRGPAGFAIPKDRHHVVLGEQRSELLGFEVEAPKDRGAGIDVLRIRFGDTKVELPVHSVVVQVPRDLRIGVLRSRDDTLPSVLGVGGFGVHWSELSDADIAAADLSEFDTIVVDVRALRDRDEARRGFRRVLDFATAKGKRVVFFYQKDVEFHPDGEGFAGAPFAPFTIGKGRVTRADAPVRLLRPAHVLLNRPNVIQPADWDAWEQERALYLPAAYSPQYEELLEIQDPGRPPERSALLYARTGEGEFVYCSLALWRQLKKLHPGAVRLLANLVTPATR